VLDEMILRKECHGIMRGVGEMDCSGLSTQRVEQQQQQQQQQQQHGPSPSQVISSLTHGVNVIINIYIYMVIHLYQGKV